MNGKKLVWLSFEFSIDFRKEIPTRSVFLHLKSVWEQCCMLVSNQEQPGELELRLDQQQTCLFRTTVRVSGAVFIN